MTFFYAFSVTISVGIPSTQWCNLIGQFCVFLEQQTVAMSKILLLQMQFWVLERTTSDLLSVFNLND